MTKNTLRHVRVFTDDTTCLLTLILKRKNRFLSCNFFTYNNLQLKLKCGKEVAVTSKLFFVLFYFFIIVSDLKGFLAVDSQV